MKAKYVMDRHTDEHYFDPQTGILKLKENYERDRRVDEGRERELVRKIMSNVSTLWVADVKSHIVESKHA